MVDKNTILKTAKMAALKIPEADVDLRLAQFRETLDYVKVLKELDTINVLPSFSASKKTNVWRQDLVKPSIPQSEALKNARKTYQGYFVCQAVKRKK